MEYLTVLIKTSVGDFNIWNSSTLLLPKISTSKIRHCLIDNYVDLDSEIVGNTCGKTLTQDMSW